MVQTGYKHRANNSISGQNIECVNISSNETTINGELDRCEFGNWEHVELREGKHEIRNNSEKMVVNYTVHALKDDIIHEGRKEIQLQVDTSQFCVS